MVKSWLNDAFYFYVDSKYKYTNILRQHYTNTFDIELKISFARP